MEPLHSFQSVVLNNNNWEAPVNANEEVEAYQCRVNEMSEQVLKLEKKVEEIEHFFSNNKGTSFMSRQSQPPSRPASLRMQYLISQFRTIFNQLTQRKRSSGDSLDADGLGLHDFPEVSGKPKDLNCVRMRLQAEDDSGYTHVRDIYTDVRLVLKNAMKHNDEKSDGHVTARTLLSKFEEKWYILLPKVLHEEERRKEEGLKQETYQAQMAKEVSSELCKVELYLKELKESVLQRCRRMSTLEKKELGRALTKLSAEDLTKALEIVAQDNPDFQVTAEEVDLDIDAQSESTLWRLKHFIVDVLKNESNIQSKSVSGDKNDKDNTLVNTSKACKRKSETVLMKPAKKKTKKVSSIV